MSGTHRKAVAAAILLATLPWVSAVAQVPASVAVSVSTEPIPRFGIASSETRFGELEYVGGFSISADEDEFGQLSGFRFLSPGTEFLAVADHGYWVTGSIERDDAGVPVGISGMRMQAMVDRDGRRIEDKVEKDAEGLDVRDGIATVSFERQARISEYAIDPAGIGGPIRDLDIVVPREELRNNRGFETLVRAHPDTIHQGARIVVAERSIDANGDVFAGILEGPEKGVFKVRRSDGYDITDGASLPDGDLLLLERRFSATHGAGVRVRRINGKSIRQGAAADGPVLMEANLAHQIDNMEAMDVWWRDDGALIVSLVSDDNQSFLQRTLYLEFRLVE